MTDKELASLKRNELLELLLIQTRKVNELEKEIEELKAQLENRQIRIEKAGSIAEAALSLNKVFEAAQEAADQYLENIKRRSGEE